MRLKARETVTSLTCRRPVLPRSAAPCLAAPPCAASPRPARDMFGFWVRLAHTSIKGMKIVPILAALFFYVRSEFTKRKFPNRQYVIMGYEERRTPCESAPQGPYSITPGASEYTILCWPYHRLPYGLPTSGERISKATYV